MMLKDYQLTLSLAGPILSAGVGTLRFGVDTAMARFPNTPDGEPVLNGSLIRGNIVDTCRQSFMPYLPADEKKQLEEYLQRWFGSEGDDLLDVNRSQVDFDFFWKLSADDLASLQKHKPQHRTRIAMDNELDKVKQGALQVIEDIFVSGSKVEFSGKLFARFADDIERKAFEHWVNKAIAFIPALGSFKGVGYGRLLNSSGIGSAAPLANLSGVVSKGRPLKLGKDVTRFGIRLYFDRPFCLGKLRTPQDNRIVSEAIIPGTVLKGVIARQCDKPSDALSRFLKEQFCFDELVISHAVPVASPATYSRATQLPFSAAMLDGSACDLALFSSPSKLDFTSSPIFQSDMKSAQYEEANEAFGMTAKHPSRHLIVRTQIDARGVSGQSGLFSMECIDPADYCWQAEIDLVNIDKNKRAKVFKNLTALFKDSLRGVGKTKARVQASVFLLPKPKKKPVIHALDGYWVIELITACSMLPLGLNGTVTATDLQDLYAHYWHDISGGVLTLSHYFAQQSRVGGAFYHKHFQKGAAYQPEYLSTAGSVFVLKANDEAKARGLIEAWLATGLPHVANASTPDIVGWQESPYLPEHGYGEIQVNHQRLKRLTPTPLIQEAKA